MLALISENSWKLDEIERQETIDSLKNIVNESILSPLFELYTEPSANNGRYKYREEMVCRVIAQNILQQGLKFHITDFLTTWQEALPEGMLIDVSKHCGHYNFIK